MPGAVVEKGPKRRFASLRSRALAITAAYAATAALWIYTSDQALDALAPDAQALLSWSVYKGVAFVAVTAVMLFLLMARAFGSIERSYLRVRAHEAELEKVNRWLAALSQVKQAILWEKAAETLLPRACAALVEHGGARCAWIALREPDGSLTCAAIAPPGADGFDVDIARLAMRSEAGIAHNRLAEVRGMGEWVDRAVGLGHRSVAGCALRLAGEPVGCVVALSDDGHEFQPRQLALIEESAMDLSLALETFRNEDARRSAQQQAEHEASFSSAMIESLPGVVYFYDETGRFLRWNRNFQVVTGYSDAEIAAMHPLDFFGPADRELVAARIAEVFETGVASVEAGFLARDGRVIPYLFTGRRIAFEGKPCLVGMGIDITVREQAVRALRELNETLEARVAKRTSELSAALVRAEAADRLKSAFLATMSHELRTPLNSIIGFTGILQKGLAGPVNAEQVKQLGMVRASARHLLDLINDVLDLSKIEAGQLEVRRDPLELGECIERVVGIVQPLARAKSLDLQCGPLRPLQMRGDRRRIEQILLNLLNNAVKFTDRGSIRVDVEAAEPGGEVRISVRDTGIGIRAEDLDKLFLPFRQVDDGLARQHEGTGLGLAICRRLAGLMGGRIDVQSRFETGSTFALTLPLEHP